MKAIGITCGVGSMLVGARMAGFDVIGNVEWRKYYHWTDEHGRNTFREYFQGAVFKDDLAKMTEEEFRKFSNTDLAMGHPECGNFSALGGVNKGAKEKLTDPTDIPLFVNMVAKLRPRFFVMDDLPKSFMAYPMSEYAKALPDYDLFPEWVCNWGYGNVQKHRDRMFMVGSRKDERWAFVPGEFSHKRTLETAIGDLPTPRVGSNYPNHYPAARREKAQKSLSLRFIGDRPTWDDVAEFARVNWKPGESMTYHANDGTIKRKPGCKIEHYDYHGASVQDGGSYKLHPIRFDNLTLRERARIQGFPDDFVFYGAKLNGDGEYNPDRNVHMAKQTGKAMPIQFNRYAAMLVKHHIEGTSFEEATNTRILPPNSYVDDAKRWYCSEVGYADQERACGACWLYRGCTIRTNKYGIGASARSPETTPSEQGAGAPGPVTGRTLRKPAASRGSADTAKVELKPSPVAASKPAASYQRTYGKGVSNL